MMEKIGKKKGSWKRKTQERKSGKEKTVSNEENCGKNTTNINLIIGLRLSILSGRLLVINILLSKYQY